MAIILFVCTLMVGALAAPAINNGVNRNWEKELADNLELKRLYYEGLMARERRSGYGNVYMSPCAAAAASAPIPSYHPAAAAAAPLPAYASPTAVPYSYGHQYQTAPAHRGHSSYYSYDHPYYRSEEDSDSEQEMLGFSDMNTFDHMPTARYSYGAAPAAPVDGGAKSTGPIVGVFTNAHAGGCSIPLLVSCSPTVTQGWVGKAQPYYAGGSAQGSLYRVVDEHPHHVQSEGHQETISPEHSSVDSQAQPKNDKHQ